MAHDFEVTGYYLLNGMGVGKHICSSTFSIGGYDWNITFYPEGFSVEQAGFASAYLKCRGEESVRVKYTFSLLDTGGNQINTKERK
jgi:speckle-type POZ protein